MKSFSRLVLAALLASPLAASANRALDHRIEEAARGSYNFRVLLDERVKATAEDGVVTLTGEVQDADQKQLAEDTAKNLPGVTRVENRITVTSGPQAQSDAWIAWKARGVLLMRANVSAADTDISVQGGRVTLRGATDSVAQKELTEAYVKDLDGVKSVDNQLAVEEPGAKSGPPSDIVDDSSITAQVENALRTHRSTHAATTEIATKHGIVTIRGEAGSEAERDLVTHLAESVRGVKGITNNMKVVVSRTE